MGLQIQTHAMTWRCVAFCFGLVRLYLGNLFARWVYKKANARNDMQSPKSPNPDLSFFAFKRRFVPACASLNRGFRGLMTWRCVAFCVGWVRLYRGKIFARWVYKKGKRTQWHDDALLFLSDWCVCIEVKYSQDGFTQNTNARDDMTMRCLLFRIGAFV